MKRLLLFNNKKGGHQARFNDRLKLKLGVFRTGHTVAMVTYNVKTFIVTSILFTSSDLAFISRRSYKGRKLKAVILQSVGKCCEQVVVTLLMLLANHHLSVG